jgi:hypothetical protein
MPFITTYARIRTLARCDALIDTERGEVLTPYLAEIPEQ